MSTNSDLSFDKLLAGQRNRHLSIFDTTDEEYFVGLRSQDYAGKGDKAIFLKYLG